MKKFLQEFYQDDEFGKKQFKYGNQLVSLQLGRGNGLVAYRSCKKWPNLFQQVHLSVRDKFAAMWLW